MEYIQECFQLTQHVLTENKIMERNFEDNCTLVLNDLNSFNLTSCLNQMNDNFYHFIQYFFKAFTTGLKTRWHWLFGYLLLIILIIKYTGKFSSLVLHPLHVLVLIILQITTILLRKCVWSFILSQPNISPVTSIVKIFIQKMLNFQASNTLKILIFENFNNNLKNQISYFVITLTLVYALYIKPFLQNWDIKHSIKNYSGLTILIIIIFCETFITETLYSGTLAITDPLTKIIIDLIMEQVVNEIIKPLPQNELVN